MSARGIGLVAFALAFALGGAAACSDGDEERPAHQDEQDDTGGTSSGTGGSPAAGSGTVAAGAAGEGPGGATGGADEPSAGSGPGGAAQGGASTAGAAGSPSGGSSQPGGGSGGQTAACGNGVVEANEDCDGEQFAAGVDCKAFGFDDGSLRCNDDCTADPSECSGTESCYDGQDNDGDSLVDCLDEADCAAACSDPCSDPPTLPDPGSVYGTTAGSVDLSSASCSASPSGTELAYEVTAETAGILDVELSSFQLLTVSLRTSCAEAATELGCDSSRLSVPVTAGEIFYVMVEGLSAADSGEFTLSAASRPATVCGDGALDPGEECEDENTEPGDGCDADCRLESTENEPNDTVDSADSFADPYYAQIQPAGDEDVIAVEVAEGPASLMVTTFNVGIGMCALELMDSYLEILDTNGTTVLAADDDGSDGFCASASTFALPAGTYYVRVRASEYALAGLETFPYRLGVSLDVCGNGAIGAGEQCDDGNTESFDGCSSVCRIEPGY